MNLLIATATPLEAPAGIAIWLACAFFVIGLINSGTKMVRGWKDRPAPGEVRAESVEKFLAKTEFQSHLEWNRREHENLFAKIGGMDRGITSRIEARLDKMEASNNAGRDKIHDRINEVLEAVSELRGRVDERKHP